MVYIDLVKDSGWEITHVVDCPVSTQRFLPNMVIRMEKNRTLGVVQRSLIIGRKKWMNKAASAREPVNYDEIGDAIVPLRKQGQFIKKNTWRDHSQFVLS